LIAGAREPHPLYQSAVALKQIIEAQARLIPVAGGGYFSVAANGDCMPVTAHRSSMFRVGNNAAPTAPAAGIFARRHVTRSRPAPVLARICVRGMSSGSFQQDRLLVRFCSRLLEFCLAAYCELSVCNPEFFAQAPDLRRMFMSQAPIKLITECCGVARGQHLPTRSAGAGNPVSTRPNLVSELFPGLECDLRNLERRFFPSWKLIFRTRRST